MTFFVSQIIKNGHFRVQKNGTRTSEFLANFQTQNQDLLPKLRVLSLAMDILGNS